MDSDHRAVFCDIDGNILKTETNDSTQVLERLIGTKSTNKEGEKYIRELNGFCEYHRIYEKVNYLLNIIESTDYNSDNIIG
jgi:hypothetical protein